MKNRTDAVNEVYLPYVKKHLGNNPLQNILTCGGSGGAVNAELERHEHLQYENIFHYELVDDQIHYDEVIKDNILCPELPIQSVNLIYADVGGSGVNIDGWEYGCISNILDNGFIDNELGVLVFLYFDGIGIESFLDEQYGNYNSKDFFSQDVTWYDEYNKATFIQRLDGVVFYE